MKTEILIKKKSDGWCFFEFIVEASEEEDFLLIAVKEKYFLKYHADFGYDGHFFYYGGYFRLDQIAVLREKLFNEVEKVAALCDFIKQITGYQLA